MIGGSAGRRADDSRVSTTPPRSVTNTVETLRASPADPPTRPALNWNLWIDPDGHPGPWNMAADHTLLEAAQHDAAWLRLYRWSPGCLSFGRNEPAASRYDRDRIRALGIDVVRRPTGGRAVWHDAEVTYAVAAPVSAFFSLGETYLTVHRLIARALDRLGIPASIATRPEGGHPGIAAGACFASPAGGEVIVGGRKLVGSAQVREGTAFLQHGSILLEDSQDLVSRVTRGAQLPPHATSVSATLGRSATFQEVAAALASEAQASWDGTWTPSERVPNPEATARFADPAWTWRR